MVGLLNPEGGRFEDGAEVIPSCDPRLILFIESSVCLFYTALDGFDDFCRSLIVA
jgi:hypothetical protein